MQLPPLPHAISGRGSGRASGIVRVAGQKRAKKKSTANIGSGLSALNVASDALQSRRVAHVASVQNLPQHRELQSQASVQQDRQLTSSAVSIQHSNGSQAFCGSVQASRPKTQQMKT